MGHARQGRTAVAGSVALVRRLAGRDVPVDVGAQTRRSLQARRAARRSWPRRSTRGGARGAIGVTFYDWSGTGPEQWDAIARDRLVGSARSDPGSSGRARPTLAADVCCPSSWRGSPGRNRTGGSSRASGSRTAPRTASTGSRRARRSASTSAAAGCASSPRSRSGATSSKCASQIDERTVRDAREDRCGTTTSASRPQGVALRHAIHRHPGRRLGRDHPLHDRQAGGRERTRRKKS